MKFKWKDLVRSVAPVIGTALGGPLGGVAARTISKVLLGHENASEEELEQAVLNANPEQLLALKNADNQFKKDMKALDVELDKAKLEDVQDARGMAIANMWPQIILSTVFIGGYFHVVASLISGDIVIPEGQAQIVNVLVGVMTVGVTNIMQFWFGSSIGSKEKTVKLR